MTSARTRLTALLAGSLVLACACSTSTGRGAHTTSASTPPDSASTAVQNYVDAVNQLCDALLPKVIAVTHGGSLDVPVKDYLAQQPAHAKLLADFDKQLAAVPIPPTAVDKATVFAAYVYYADQLDAKRLAAAKRGTVAYAAEIKVEEAAPTDPSVTARNAAGFHASCDAR